MRDDVLKVIAKIMFPFIQIFAVYIMFHGHLSPGGGFAGGTIMAAAFMLYFYAYPHKREGENLNRFLFYMLSIGLLLYGALKGLSFFGVIPHGFFPIHSGELLGGGLILPLNLIVGMIVAFSMVLFFQLFSEGEED